MPRYKVVRITGKGTPKLQPVLLDVPDHLDTEDGERIADWAMRLIWEEKGLRDWHESHVYVSEKEAVGDHFLSAMFNSPEWSKLNPVWFKEPKTPMEALDYAKAMKKPIPQHEHLLAENPAVAFSYSVEIGSRFHAGEKTISGDAKIALQYADYHCVRMKDAEGFIAAHDEWASDYGRIMSESSLWETWSEKEIARHPAWIYHYCRVLSHPPSESLDSAMMMLSFSHHDNKWVKKYLKLKKQRSRKNKKSESFDS